MDTEKQTNTDVEKRRCRISGKTVFVIVWLVLLAAVLAAIIIAGPGGGEKEDIAEVMKDGVLHENDRVNLFGLLVSPAVISAFTVTGMLLTAALLIRIFAVPKMKTVPGPFQSVLEKAVEFVDGMAKGCAPRFRFAAGAFLFSAGAYVAFGTLFELFGLQVVSAEGKSVTMPAPIADINGAIAVGVTSFVFILAMGIAAGGAKGGLKVMKDFSLPISMSFRLYGALLSGLLVTELVYHYTATSFVLPIAVAVLFTLLHAVIQTYVLTTLVSIFCAEATEPANHK